jgi:hypothetical protein
VFTLAITPKKTLHALLANHTDNTAKSKDGERQQLSKAGFNCKCDNLVAESTFVSNQYIFSFAIFTFFSAYTFKEISFYSISKSYNLLRGPPINLV